MPLPMETREHWELHFPEWARRVFGALHGLHLSALRSPETAPAQGVEENVGPLGVSCAYKGEKCINWYAPFMATWFFGNMN